MVTTETFHHAVFAAGPAAESAAVREYAANRLRNTVKIGHELEAQFASTGRARLATSSKAPSRKPRP
jgi:hypothetical protein